MFRHPRLFTFLALVALLSVVLAGCGLKPGNNDSSSTPPVVLTTGGTSGISANGPDVSMSLATAGQVVFSHKTHVDNYKQSCDQCHLNDTPWPMKNQVMNVTMEQMEKQKLSCGKCHTGEKGWGFDLSKYENCAKCHQEIHKGVSATKIGHDQCTQCHADIVKEYEPLQPSAFAASGTSHGRTDWIALHANAACGECHHHEAVTLGKAGAIANQPLSNHTIACQSCHYPTEAAQKAAGTTFPYRLRKNGNDLCATCHHTRYTYVPAYPTLPTYSTGGVSNLPVELMGISNNGDAQFLFNNTATLSGSISSMTAAPNKAYLGGTTMAAITGGNYPHDSTQYNLMMGRDDKTHVAFSKDLNGRTLVYSDSVANRMNPNSCAECHMARTAGSGKYGHTFVPATKQTVTNYATHMAALKTYLDVNKDGNVNWGRSSEDADLRLVMRSATIPDYAKVLLLAAGWNYLFIEGDGSHGNHNPEYAVSLASNTSTILGQVKTKGTGSWWTW